MPELAPIETRPPQGSCPSAEDLACYVDRTLSPEEAARVTAHLASCESCFEVYSGVLRFQLDESELAQGDNVVPFPREKRHPAVPWWSSIAALLVVTLGVGGYSFYSYFLAPPQPLVTDQVIAPIQGKPTLWFGKTMRGSEDEGERAPFYQAAFRLGVQVVNLQVRLKAGERDDARNVVAYILGVLKTMDGSGPLDESYKALGTEIDDKTKDTRALLPRAANLAEDARDFDPLYFDLGQWVEAGYLAAIAQDPAFFQQPENRSFLRHVLWRDQLGIGGLKLPKADRQDLDAISKILDKSWLQTADYTELQKHFENILNANYPK